MLIASLLFGVSASLDSLLVGISYGIRGIRIRLWQNLFISLVTLLGTCLSVGLGQRLAPLLPGFIGRYAGSLVLIVLGIYYIAKWAAAICRGCGAVGMQACSAEPEEKPSVTGAVAEPEEESSMTGAVAEPEEELSVTGAVAEPEEELSERMPEPGLSACAGGIEPQKAALQLRAAEVLTLSLTLSLNNLSAGLSASLAGLTLIPAAVSTIICSVLFLFSGNRLGQNPVLQLAGRAADPLSGMLLIGLGLIQIFI